MASYRRAIRIRADERDILQELYLSFRIPSDQYNQRSEDLRRLTDAWNGATGRSDEPGEVLHYIVTQRKQKLWVTFDGDHEQLAGPAEDFLTPQEWQHLEAIYNEILVGRNIGSDNLGFDPSLAREVSTAFFRRAGRSVSGRQLLAAILTRRKRGEWIHLEPGEGEEGLGFGDIDQIA
jgi:hypothetical protein